MSNSDRPIVHTVAGLSDLREKPFETLEAGHGEPVAITVHDESETVFYAVPVKVFEKLVSKQTKKPHDVTVTIGEGLTDRRLARALHYKRRVTARAHSPYIKHLDENVYVSEDHLMKQSNEIFRKVVQVNVKGSKKNKNFVYSATFVTEDDKNHLNSILQTQAEQKELMELTAKLKSATSEAKTSLEIGLAAAEETLKELHKL